MKYFHDRVDAGRQLALALSSYQSQKDIVVLGLLRGGIPIAYQVAIALHVPQSVLLVRKFGVPNQEELAMGAISEEDVFVQNEDLIALLKIPQTEILKELQFHTLSSLNVSVLVLALVESSSNSCFTFCLLFELFEN